ncbi:cytochrome B6 [Sorangium cellulosum]|uniref:Cytochrome B6 n=2 Tax=Sorangium cellulosum TaxID=56 RepID=A0A4P2QC76_SORCE|nr:cytochrome B6 [Sorangium cellulosum]AUX26723.1 cytochrome B6 [Sorangium cellulosum]
MPIKRMDVSCVVACTAALSLGLVHCASAPVPEPETPAAPRESPPAAADALAPAGPRAPMNANPPPGPEVPRTSYLPVVDTEPFATIMARMKAEKPSVMKRQRALLEQRYDLADRPARGVTMSRGKPVQAGVRVKLPKGTTWEALAALTPEAIRAQGLWPKGFLPLPHPNHPEGGMVFPQFQIDELKRQTGRDLTRFDVDFDLPDHLLSEFPPPIYLTTRPDLGDVSKGQLVTIDNYYELFNGILNPKQLEGLRLLVTPFPQMQFNATADRRSERPSLGVACLDCHANGHTNNATHLVGDIRPQEFRHRIDTPTLRGVNVQRLFGSQRALKTVEDFTEFEQRAAYFDGDPVIAVKKGINILDRGHQTHTMSEFQAILDFPPAPKLDVEGRLDPAKATPEELRGEQVFHGKGRCGSCHPAPYYTDNLMHNLQTERFHEPVLINGRMATADGPIKTFPLRGIKDSPPYLHDGRLLTLEDTVEFFNLVLGLRLTAQEKSDLTAFMRAL